MFAVGMILMQGLELAGLRWLTKRITADVIWSP